MSFLSEVFPPVLIELKVNAGEAITSLRAVNGELVKMKVAATKAGTSLDLIAASSKVAKAAFLGIAGTVTAVGFASVHAYESILKSQANLEVAVKNTGVIWENAKPYVDTYSKSMLDLGFTYQDTYAALSKMTAATGSPSEALASLAAVSDLARFKQISLLDAANLLARASVGQARGLGDLGLAIKKTIPEGASFEQILKIVESRVSGSADAFKNTLPGAIAITKANFQALEIQIGTQLLPTVENVAIYIRKKIIPALKEFVDWIKHHEGFIQTFMVALATLWAAPKIMGLLSSIGLLTAAYTGLAGAASAAAIAEGAATSMAGFSAADRAVLDAIAGGGTAAAARRAAGLAGTAETAVGAAGAGAAVAGAAGAAGAAAILIPTALLVGKAVYDQMIADKTANELSRAVNWRNLDLGKATGISAPPNAAKGLPWWDILGKAKASVKNTGWGMDPSAVPTPETSPKSSLGKNPLTDPSVTGKGIKRYDLKKAKATQIHDSRSYNVTINSNADPHAIAHTVMAKINQGSTQQK